MPVVALIRAPHILVQAKPTCIEILLSDFYTVTLIYCVIQHRRYITRLRTEYSWESCVLNSIIRGYIYAPDRGSAIRRRAPIRGPLRLLISVGSAVEHRSAKKLRIIVPIHKKHRHGKKEASISISTLLRIGSQSGQRQDIQIARPSYENPDFINILGRQWHKHEGYSLAYPESLLAVVSMYRAGLDLMGLVGTPALAFTVIPLLVLPAGMLDDDMSFLLDWNTSGDALPTELPLVPSPP